MIRFQEYASRRPTRRLAAAGWAVLCGLCLSVSATPPAAAQGAAPVFDQIEADIGPGAGGNAQLLVWSEDRGAGARIYAKRVWNNGIPVGGATAGDYELTAATGAGAFAGQKGIQRWPTLFTAGSDRRAQQLVVWSEQAPGAADFDIYAQRLAGNGRALGSARAIVTGPGDQVQPDVITIPNGYLVVYSEDTADAGDIMAQRITTALTPRDAPYAMAQGPGVATEPELGFAYSNVGAGEALLVIFTYVPDGATSSDIYAVRASSIGVPRGGAANIFPLIESPDVDESTPHLAAGAFDSGSRARDRLRDSFVGLLLYTRDDPADAAGADVYGVRFQTIGFITGQPVEIAAGPGSQAAPTSTHLDDRNWIVVWQEDGGGSFDVRSLRVRSNGVPHRTARALVAD
jgi:hypothetical protein